MSRVATAELGLAPAAVADNNGGGFDVFSSLRSGAGGEDFSSGDGDIGEEAAAGVDEAAGKIDLVAVASGEAELDTSIEGSGDSKNAPPPVDALSLAGKSEINSPENRMSNERRAAICQGVASAACASCAARDACPILRMRNFASENLQPAPERKSYLSDLLNDGDDGIIVAGYANPDSGADLTNTDIAEASDDKADQPTEQVAPPNQDNKSSVDKTAKSADEPEDVKESEQSFFEPAAASEAAVDDSRETREVQQENVGEASVNTSDEAHFTESTEENRPPVEIKQQTSAIISGAADKASQQSAFKPSDMSTQTKTRTVPPSISEDTQAANKNNILSKNETVSLLSGESKPVDGAVENTYDSNNSNDIAATSDIKPSSVEPPKESDVVMAAPKSSNPKLEQAAAGSSTPIFEQRLAAQFDEAEIDEPAAEPIDNSSVKPLQNTQPREVKFDIATSYDDPIQALDGADNKQPGSLTPDVDDAPLSQERTVAVSVLAEYDENETYQSPDSYSIDQSSKTPQANRELTATQAIDYSFSKAEKAAINKQNVADTERHESAARVHQPQAEAVLSQTQILAESSEDSLVILDDRTNFDDNLAQSKIDDVKVGVFAPNDVVNTTDKTDVPADIEMIDATLNLPDKSIAIDRNDAQRAVDLPQELSNESAVDTDASESQISVVKQLDRDDVPADSGQNEDGVWLEEEVFFVKQDLSAVEPEPTSAEVAAVVSPAEVVTAREEADNLKLSVDDEIGIDMDSVGQLDNSKAASVPEITNDYEPEEQIAIPTSLAIEPIRDVELDEPVVEISEERIMPREEHDSIVMEASEKSDLPRLDDEVEAIITDTSGVEPAIDLPEAQEELAANEVSEVDEQNDSAVASAVDSYGYNSGTSAVSDNVLVVKGRPSSGLWSDDSRLNPEEESASTTQSSADDTSLVSRLVGVLVVAMCVARGKHTKVLLSG